MKKRKNKFVIRIKETPCGPIKSGERVTFNGKEGERMSIVFINTADFKELTVSEPSILIRVESDLANTVKNFRRAINRNPYTRDMVSVRSVRL